jgi:hypothetical protein
VGRQRDVVELRERTVGLDGLSVNTSSPARPIRPDASASISATSPDAAVDLAVGQRDVAGAGEHQRNGVLGDGGVAIAAIGCTVMPIPASAGRSL